MKRVAIVISALALLCCASVAMAKTKRLSATESSNSLGYSKKSITVKAGSVTLKMKNPSSLDLDHSIAIKGNGVSKKGKVVAPGGTSKVKKTLSRGTYTYYCTVEGHESDGMKGTLTVTR